MVFVSNSFTCSYIISSYIKDCFVNNLSRDYSFVLITPVIGQSSANKNSLWCNYPVIYTAGRERRSLLAAVSHQYLLNSAKKIKTLPLVFVMNFEVTVPIFEYIITI